MKTHQITFTEKNRAELLETEMDDQLAPNQALVRSEHSVVSAGTEGAGFTGLGNRCRSAAAAPTR